MIKFKCSNCNHQINAPEKYAGKRVRCPKCKAPIRVPKSVPNTGTQEPKLIKFRCPSCNQKIGLAQHYAGKRVRCAKCKQPLRVPELQAEAVDSGPASEEGRIDDMFDDDIGSGGMFDDKMLTDELLTFEGGAPAVEETPALKPLSPRMETEPRLSCPNCGSLNRADSQFCTTCAHPLASQVGLAGGPKRRFDLNNMAFALGASLGLAILGGVVWCITAGLVGVGWVSFMAVVVCYLAGLGLTLFTDRRGAGMGLVAILIGFIGIIGGKLMIAKWVVMPKIMPEMKKVFDDGLEEIKEQDMPEELVQDTLANAEMMFALTLMQLVDDGEFEEEFVKKAILARFTGERQPQFQEEMERAEKRVYECLASWSSDEKETVVRNQYPKVIGEFAGFLMEGGLGTAIGFIAAFFGALSCQDVLWFPLGLFFAYKVGAGRD